MRSPSRFAILTTCSLLVAAAAAQTPALAELKTLHERLTSPKGLLTEADGRLASDRLAEWKLDPTKLETADKLRLLTIETLAPLARGDAAKAGEKARELVEAAGTDAKSLDAAYLGAVAAGDAQTAELALRRRTDSADANLRKELSRKRQWTATVGRKAPEVEIRTEDGKEFIPTKRGDKVLIIDFWNSLSAPSAAQLTALQKLYEEVGSDQHVDFIGVNADSENRLDKAREFAAKNKMTWPQRYEAVAVKAPITHEAFKAGPPPWLVLVDSYGYIRAIGDAAEPAFQYALRAALAEARLEFEAVMPRTRDGKQATPPGSNAGAASGGKKEPERTPPKSDLPSNAEARSKLQQAHSMRRGGMKTKARQMYEEIVRDYPGTKEAEEAAFWLE